MAKKSKKEKKRKEAIKQKKAKTRALPKLLRNEALLEALSSRLPLVECLINEDWQEEKLANVFVIREGPGGLVFSSFVVDLADRGLRDARGSVGASLSDLERIKAESSGAGFPLVQLDKDLAEKIVHGGIAWAGKWGYKLPREYQVWIRLLDPPPPSGIDLGLFGVDGKPFHPVTGRDGDDFYEELLSDDIRVSEEGFTRDTLIRIGDIKQALVHFAKGLDFHDEMNIAFEIRLGKPKPPESEDAWIDFLDWFILEYELREGGTIASLFVDHYDEIISEDVQELILGWEEVIEGLFEVKGVSGYAVDMKNLINEREYRVFSTVPPDNHGFHPGDFLSARIIPAKGFHLFSGGVKILLGDGKGGKAIRAKVYRAALEMQMKNPRLAFKDNPKKLQKSKDSVCKYYEYFVRRFDGDEVMGTGKDILAQFRSFFEYLGRELRDRAKNDTAGPYPPQAELPNEKMESDDVGMLCDPVEGISFLVDYGRFIDAFRSPERHLGHEETEVLVMEYLESDSVSDVPFRRMAERFPENFKRVVAYYRDRCGFFSSDIEDLMQEFKPWTFEKLPGIVSILDAEMARIAKTSDQQTSSTLGRIKKWFS